jgi:hypothetical protein
MIRSSLYQIYNNPRRQTVIHPVILLVIPAKAGIFFDANRRVPFAPK